MQQDTIENKEEDIEVLEPEGFQTPFHEEVRNKKFEGSIYEPKEEVVKEEPLSFEPVEEIPKFDKEEFPVQKVKRGRGRPPRYPKKAGDLIKVVKRSVTKTVATSREQSIKTIYKHKDKILEAQIAGAVGFYYESADGKHVYQRKPDLGTGEYLLNQLIGKPKESIEIKSVNLRVDF